jgi:hypothetical protein
MAVDTEASRFIPDYPGFGIVAGGKMKEKTVLTGRSPQ